MDNVKEKIIELLHISVCDYDCEECKHSVSDELCIKYLEEMAADSLISNGVIIQKHGKWEMVNHREVEPVADYACSVCNGLLIDVIDDPHHELSPYCPMCGARMDLEDK